MPLSVQFASPGFLAWGWILVAIPILVHLLMRRKPSHYEFPTLRFLRAAQKKQSTRIKLQHLLLLLLRILLILLILLAFSRPQMRLRTSIWSHDEPVDAVLLVDTSPSMEALIGGGTTLDRARPWGRAFIGALPQGSRVAVMTSQLAPIEWSMRAHELDRKLAELEVQEGVSSMAPAIRRASKLFERMSDRRRVFYVLTDLTGIALPPKVFDGWAEQIPVHLVDLAGDGLSNLYLEQLSLSQTSVLRGTPVTVSGVVSGQGRAGRVTLDLIVAGRTLQSRPIEVTDGGRAPFRFVFPARTPGVMQGQVRIREQDVLPPDNALYFTVRVFRTLPLRVVSDPAFSRSSSWRWLKLALDPEEKGRRLATELLLPGQLAQRTLARSRILILPEVTGLTDEGWAAIEEFVSSGGGLLVLLGPDLRLPEWRTPKAREVLGMEIVGPERLSKPLGLARVDWAHPLLASFEAGKNGNLMDVEWLGVARIVAGGQAKVLARLAESGLPAILERPLGRGRMLVLSGGINPRWGELIKSYAFVPLLQEALKYLAQFEARQVNFRVGQTAKLELDPGTEAHRIRLVGPGGASRVVMIGDTENTVSLPLDDGPGNYGYLLEGRRGVIGEGGFSASFPTEESDLTRLERTGLGPYLGLPKLAALETRGGDTDQSPAGASTHELTPLIALLLLLLLTFESYLSTFKYR